MILTLHEIEQLRCARRLLLFIGQKGTLPPEFDELERSRLMDVADNIDMIVMGVTSENQLSRERMLIAERAHAREAKSVCGSCGGRAINGSCIRRCEV